MTDATVDRVQGSGAPSPDHVLSAERQLMLVDRINVLQNELAEWRVRDQMTHQRINHELVVVRADLDAARAENARLEAALAEVKRSNSWRIGRLVLTPVRAAKWVRARRGPAA